MTQLHISEKGSPVKCKAKPGQCPLTLEDGSPMPHFQDKDTAYKYIELTAEANEANSRYGGAITKQDVKKETEDKLEEKIEETSNTLSEKSSEDSEEGPVKTLDHSDSSGWVSEVAKMKVNDQWKAFENGSEEERNLMAENIDKMKLSVQKSMVNSKDSSPKTMEKILENTSSPNIFHEAERSPNTRINKFMRDERLADYRAMDKMHGGEVENSKYMNKEIYDRMNKTIAMRHGEDSEKENSVKPAFVAQALKNGDFSLAEKAEILKKGGNDLVAEYAQANPDDEIMKMIPMNRQVRVHAVKNSKDPDYTKFHARELEIQMVNDHFEFDARDKAGKTNWYEGTRFKNKINLEANIALDNKNLDKETVENLVNVASHGRRGHSEKASYDSYLLSRAYSHPNSGLEEKRKYYNYDRKNQFVDDSHKAMFEDDEKSFNKGENGDGSNDSLVEDELKNIDKAPSRETLENRARLSDSPSEIRALMLKGRVWSELRENKNLNDKQKEYIEKHFKWDKEMRNRSN